MRSISLYGIQDPNLSFLIRNILKNSDEKEEFLFIISEGNGNGLDLVAQQFGYSVETQKSGNTIEMRFIPTGQTMKEIDVCGDVCPGPVITVGSLLKDMSTGEQLKIIAANQDSVHDISAAVNSAGSKIVSTGQAEGKFFLVVEKAEKPQSTGVSVQKEKVLIVQSNGIGNAERAYATFLFAKVAQSMGKPVTIFLLMDGVSIARAGNAASVKHPAFDRLDSMMKEVLDAGATVFACELSASFRGIKDTDLVDGIKIAGAATYLQLLSDPAFSIVNF
ncbi:DsrE family protein [Methanospirillum lacunae]|uniref:Sulfur reduction protein DsrE n=1 Tax=Methanospirillum lacunae TaxID=668570 RepID=A0A2V2N7A0_9EURY|nr:DsrE family protein [Methanospirillum lacunae]PWR74520.1 sulfur reduction protein DsrE [Methanospirillum lacunae]